MQSILAESDPHRGRAVALVVALAVLAFACFTAPTVDTRPRRQHMRFATHYIVHPTDLKAAKKPPLNLNRRCLTK